MLLFYFRDWQGSLDNPDHNNHLPGILPHPGQHKLLQISSTLHSAKNNIKAASYLFQLLICDRLGVVRIIVRFRIQYINMRFQQCQPDESLQEKNCVNIDFCQEFSPKKTRQRFANLSKALGCFHRAEPALLKGP